ncbi:unknown protein [Microcystis aeruginosa NIES-843]|uniref:Uncharacterized protein n=1 Tax=Microcystis aeruginosa (strain NIES-843 / IAM M-2473) TaxID=449447 RepID=B0JGA7_MICAN|nr:unknown protein [Microcystis aeruginosa NIES-843]
MLPISPSPPATRTKWSPHLPPQRARSGLPISPSPQFIIDNSSEILGLKPRRSRLALR